MEVISYSPIGNKVNQTTIGMRIMLQSKGRPHSGMIMVVIGTRMLYVRRVTLYQLLFGPNVMGARVIIRLRLQCHGQKLINFAKIWVLNWLLYILLKKIHFCITSVALRIPAGLGLVMLKQRICGNGVTEAMWNTPIGMMVKAQLT